jgi:glycosyltransferase involved in cell wall biosynthesis
MKSTVWIFSLEPIETRYTSQWHKYFPKIIDNYLDRDIQVIQIDGVQKNTKPTPGAFLNFSDTNFWKSSQLCNFLEFYNQGKTSTNDQFIFTDAWNPVVIQLKYMKELLGLNWKIHGLWHAGSYDPQDFLGRLIGNAPWVRHAEKSIFSAIDHNYFATDFHINMFLENLLEIDTDFIKEDYKFYIENKKIVKTGWPFEYMPNTLLMYKNMPKRDLILFPHRVAPEKQLDIFLDIKDSLPQYDFVVCQDQQLSKNEYHNLLGEAKLVFSANLQETLGISWYEGAMVDAIPMVPDRLSYSEMALDEFKYPSEWTKDFNSYKLHREKVVAQVVEYMENYDKYLPRLNTQVELLNKEFFSCTKLLEMLQ